MIRALDDLLFDRVFQPAVNRMPGACPVEAGRFFLVGAMGAAFWNIGASPAPGHAAMWLAAVAANSYLYFASGRLGMRRGRNFMRVAPGCVPARVFFAGVVACNAVGAATGHPPGGAALAFNALMLLALYLGACDAPPPREQRASGRRLALQA